MSCLGGGWACFRPKPHADRDIACLGGNPDMVDAVFTALKEFGLPVAQIRREKYVSYVDRPA